MLLTNCVEEFKLECMIRGLTPKTIKGYYNNTKAFSYYLETQLSVKDSGDILVGHIKTYINYLQKKKCKPSYINGVIKCIRAFLKFLLEEDYVKDDLMKKIKWQQEDKIIIKTFNDEEVVNLIGAFGFSTFLEARNKVLIAMLFDTGIRNFEACSIQNCDIFTDTILIHGKGRKERIIPVSPCLKKWMIKYEHIRDLYFLDKQLHYQNYFLSRTGRPLTVEGLEHIFHQARDKTEIRSSVRCSPHTARHYYAQKNLRNGMDIYSLARLLGHEKIDITKRYLQSIQDDTIVSIARASSPLMTMHLR